ncbi:MAG: hypothetical protein L6R40_000586 [Gallowayella cf. fulva]|nr:MAG: hypothetical protein L6R40_000586 [Xanthomendoza cf. fulva]
MDPVYEPISSKGDIQTSYRPVRKSSSNLSTHLTPPPPEPRPRRRRSRVFFHWLSHIMSLLWIAPIATLLWLNYSHYVVGASSWCPGHNCNADANGDNAIERATKLDHNDHNVNGALQFVAKALEVWFFFVATSLVYDMGVMFAKKGRGLPVGYLLTHLEFGDIRYILNPLLWTSPLPHRTGVPEKRARIIKLYIFACVTAMLTILANLMGPAAAVLVLPTLQWVDTPRLMYQTFNGTGATEPPSGKDIFPDCSAAQLSARNFSCTAATYGPSLDAWAAQSISSTRQAVYNEGDGHIILGSSQASALQFTINATANSDVTWVPSRQVLREMSHDFLKARGWYADWDEPEYPDREFNNSLQTILQRQGPSLGAQGNCYTGNVSDVYRPDGRWIRCYTGWTSLNTDAKYTKCLRLGLGAANRDNYAQFYLENLDRKVTQLKTGIGIYFADRATYFNDTEDFNSGIKHCLDGGDKEHCDWDKVFDAPLPDELTNTTVNVGIVSYQVPGPDRENGRVWCEHVVYQTFPTYSVDTSPRSNGQNLVMLNNLPKVEKEAVPLAMNPNWYLAAWSVNYNATLDGERQIVKELSRVLPLAYEKGLITLEGAEFMFLHMYALGQSLSMVNYYTYDAPGGDPNSKEAKAAAEDKKHPVFRSYATIHVWAYGLSGRTSKLGVAVVLLGCACVLARFLIGLTTGIQERSTVEVLAAAFEHRHQGEFEGLEEENHLAKVRYQVVEDGEGKQRFIPEKRTSRWSHAMSL